MAENVFRIKFEADGNMSSPPSASPSSTPSSTPSTGSRPNRLLDELFGNVAPRPTPDYYQEKDPAGGWRARAAMRLAGQTRGANSNELTMLRQAQNKLKRDRDKAIRDAAKKKKDDDRKADQDRKIADRDLQRRLAIGKRAVRRAASRKTGANQSTFNAVASRLGLGRGAGSAISSVAGEAGLGAGAGSIAAVAGPVGLAVLALHQFQNQIKTAGEFAREGLETVGKVAKNIASGNAVGGVATALDVVGNAATNVGEKMMGLGVPLMVLGEGVKTVSTAMKVYDEVLNSLTSRGKELAGYDGRIAAASAQAQVTKLMSDMREANQMGDRYAALISKQASMEARLNEALLPLKEKIADFVDWAMPYFEKVVEIFIAFAEQILKAVERGSKIYELFVGGPLRVLTGQLDEISKNTKKDVDYSILYDPFDDLLKKLDGLKITPPMADPFGEAADRKLMLPLFG